MSLRWPGEWEAHECTLMAWPDRPELWEGQYESVCDTFRYVACVLSLYEKVKILVRDKKSRDRVHDYFEEFHQANHANISLELIATDDVWIRDYGPIVLVTPGERLAIDFRFNAWGEKFPDFAKDDAASKSVTDHLAIASKRLEIVVEGGAIESNGRGVLMGTVDSLLSPSRKHGFGRAEFAERLIDELKGDRFVWLPAGMPEDDTDGHVDLVARFIRKDAIVACRAESNHPAHGTLEKNWSVLESLEGFELTALPVPPQRSGHTAARSYANFYIANGCVLVPAFGESTDESARETIARLFPDRRIHMVDCNSLFIEGGGIHCMTMQIPAV